MKYLQHHMKQPCGWVHIAEYACASDRQVEAIKSSLRRQFPDDEVRFEVRDVRHTVGVSEECMREDAMIARAEGRQ